MGYGFLLYLELSHLNSFDKANKETGKASYIERRLSHRSSKRKIVYVILWQLMT